MIDKYLKELVENNNRVIIPDFGAFMVQNSPEGKKISFNDFLKFNDGLLINQIIKAEKVSKNDAADKVKEFVTSIDAAFSKGESFQLKELGFLVKDNNGNIKFEKESGSKKAEPVKTDAKPTIVLDEKKDDKKGSTKPAAKAAEPKKTVEPKKTEEPKKEAPAAKTASTTANKTTKPAEPVAPPKPAAKTVAAPVTQKPAATTSKTPVTGTVSSTTKPTSKPTASSSSSSSGSGKIILIIAIILVVLGGGGFALWHFGVFNKPEPVVEVAPAPVPVIDTTPAIDTTPQVDSIIEEPEVVEEPAIDPNAKRYYIVAGSFKVPTNADNYMQKLVDDGYEAEIISRSNGFHTVSYKTLYDWNEALMEWKKMRETDAQTWILVK